MADENKKKSFWEILAIVITAIAAVLGGLNGVAALITALNGNNNGKEGAKTEAAVPTAPTKQPSSADDAAQRAAASAIAKAKAEAEAAKARAAALERQLAETEAAKAEAAAAKARAAELEKKLVAASAAPKQGDIMIDDFTGMRLAYVPGGCFMMGSPPDEEGRDEDEGPVHEVCVDGFWMGQFEVTQGQWEKVMGGNPSNFNKGGNYPVEQVSWDNAQEFIKKMNSLTGKNYRLPTEAEWEYACRANSPGRYCGGDNLDAVAWYWENSDNSTHPVGGRKKNTFDLYDMSGNVWEWCYDRYDSGYYASSPKDNPQGPDNGSYRVVRGGGWLRSAGIVQAANRLMGEPDARRHHLGFRLLLGHQ